MMTLEQQQFLALLRSGLWDTSVDVSLFSGLTVWSEIVLLAQKQTVKGIITESVNKLPVDCQPSLELMRELAFFASRNRLNHVIHNAILADVVCLFVENGIKPVLLKGQGMAVNYPNPALRHCGDIDLYIGSGDFERSISLARQWQGDAKDSMLIAKHYEFGYKGVRVELHRVAELSYIPWRNSYLQRWTEKYLDCGSLCSYVINNHTEISLPPCQFDAVFILEHAWHHFVFLGGVGLRQICDWTLYMHRYHDKIDRLALKKDLNGLGLWKAWKLFGYIAVNYLGLPPCELPFYDGGVKNEAYVVIQRILEEGYGRNSVSPITSGYIGRKLKALHHVFGRRKIMYRYEGVFNTIVYLSCFFIHGIYRMLRYWRSEA